MRGAKASLVFILILYTFSVSLLADHEQPDTDKTSSQIETNADKSNSHNETIADILHCHNDTNAEKPVDPTTLEDDPVTEKAVEEDPYWHKREQDAEKVMVETFLTDTENDTSSDASSDDFDHEPSSNNNTRRQLGKKYTGPCIAYNPIDMCWRCQPNWERNRKHLADCPLGFGRRTTGGKAGRFYVVTDPSDESITEPKPGTLRHAVIQKKPLWIIFACNMIIRLQQELIMQGDKTIDGRGANVHIAGGAGITIQFVRNVIIHNLHFHDIVPTSGGMIRDSVDHIGFRTAADGDAISVFGSSDVWIDHVSGFNAADGLIDIVAGSTCVTISNCHFVHHDKVLLFGAEDHNPSDKIMHVTIAYTHFGKKLIQRMPRCRWGFFHLVNNDYTHWLMYAIGGSQGATIISQGNRFIAPPDPQAKEITHRISGTPMEWRKWTWRSEGDLMMNGAFFVESGKKNWIKNLDRLDLIGPLPATDVTTLTKFAGPLKCIRGLPC